MKMKVTVSIGISSFPNHAKETTSLISAADKALYRSKESGRNRITVLEQ
jgi:diguanylate cyclase (GGDEF)-like protein